MLLRDFTLLGEWDERPSVQNCSVILLARLGIDLAFSMNCEREALVLVLTAFRRLCVNVFPVLLQHTIYYNMVCVAVCMLKFISADYAVNGQRLALFELIWDVRCTQFVLYSDFITLFSLYCIL